MKNSHSRARAHLTPPATTAKTETPAGPPRQTIEIAIGPNGTGHTDQAVSAHRLEDAADDTSDPQES